MKAIVAQFDHYMLLPTEHPHIRVTANDREVEARFEDRRWVFPRGDCVFLPVANTTTELIATINRSATSGRTGRCTGVRPSLIRIEVDECYGQSAMCELRDE